MKFRKNKKGFTIIELVIVVAVIGILAAVLIPTFINLKGEADRAAQHSNLYNANYQLKYHETLTQKTNRSMSEAVKVLKDYGYDTEGLFSREAEDPILYHLNENQFVHESAIPSGANKYEYWKMQSTFTGSEQYSVYAMRDFKIVDQFDSNKEADEQEYTINNLKVGFDVGENLTIKSINYDRHAESSKITAVLVTNSTTYEEEQANLTINAYVNGDDCDTIYHYGKAGYVHVINSGNHSFHTGARVGAAVVDNGRFIAGQGAKVSRAVATSADATFVKEADGQYVEPPYATTEAIKNTYNADTTKGNKVNLQYDSTKGATAADVLDTLVDEGVEDLGPAPVGTAISYENYQQTFESGVYYLKEDINIVNNNPSMDFTCHAITFAANSVVTLDLNGHTINLTKNDISEPHAVKLLNNCDFTLVDSVGDGSISNNSNHKDDGNPDSYGIMGIYSTIRVESGVIGGASPISIASLGGTLNLYVKPGLLQGLIFSDNPYHDAVVNLYSKGTYKITGWGIQCGITDLITPVYASGTLVQPTGPYTSVSGLKYYEYIVS